MEIRNERRKGHVMRHTPLIRVFLVIPMLRLSARVYRHGLRAETSSVSLLRSMCTGRRDLGSVLVNGRRYGLPTVPTVAICLDGSGARIEGVVWNRERRLFDTSVQRKSILRKPWH